MPTNSPAPEPGDPSPRGGWGPPPGGWDREPVSGTVPVPPAPRPAKPGVMELRPLGFADLLDATFAVVRLAPIPTLLNAALVQLLPALVAWAVLLPLFAGLEVPINPRLPAPGDQVPGLEGPWPAYAAAVATYLAAQLLASVLVVGPSTIAAMRATLGLRTGWGQSVALSARAMPRLAGWNLLAGTAVSAAVLLCVAGALAAAPQLGPVGAVALGALGFLAILLLYLWLGIKLCFGPTELVLRSMGIGGAMASSWSLVRGSWWRILGILWVVGIVLALLGGLVIQVLGVLFGQFVSGGEPLPPAAGVGIGLATQAVVGALSMVLGQIMLTLLHVDARIRHERLDVVLEGESRLGPAHPVPGHGARRP